MSFADIAIAIGASFVVLTALFSWCACRVAGDADRHDAAAHKLRNELLDSRANCDPRLINFKHNDGV